MKVLLSILLTYIFISLITIDSKVLTVDFEISKYDKGSIYVAIYDSEDTFLKKPLKGTVVEIENGKASAIIEGLEPGEYAVSSFYDKNGNGKLDTNFLGIPKEPTAMSNNAKGSFGPPKYKDAKFSISAKNKRINIKF